MGGENDSIQTGLHAGAMVGAAIGKLAGKKAVPAQKAAAKAPVNMKVGNNNSNKNLPPLSKYLFNTVLTHYDSKTKKMDEEGIRILKASGFTDEQVTAFVKLQNEKKHQGAEQTEVGYKPIGNAKVPPKAKVSYSRSNIDILTDTSISDSQRRAELKKANNWTDAQVNAFIKKQVTGTPAKGHLEIGDAYETMGMSRQRAYNNVASVSAQEASDYSKRIFGADFTK